MVNFSSLLLHSSLFLSNFADLSSLLLIFLPFSSFCSIFAHFCSVFTYFFLIFLLFAPFLLHFQKNEGKPRNISFLDIFPTFAQFFFTIFSTVSLTFMFPSIPFRSIRHLIVHLPHHCSPPALPVIDPFPRLK